jgi:hypothetical protein
LSPLLKKLSWTGEPGHQLWIDDTGSRDPPVRTVSLRLVMPDRIVSTAGHELIKFTIMKILMREILSPEF